MVSEYYSLTKFPFQRCREKSGSLRGRALSETEIAALMEVCFNDPQPTGARDAALFALLRGSGVRRTEAVNLNLSDLNWDTGALALEFRLNRYPTRRSPPRHGDRYSYIRISHKFGNLSR